MMLRVGLCSIPMLCAAAHGQFHGISTFTLCDSVCVGDPILCELTAEHNDGFGDSLELLEAYFVVDPLGAAIRVPAVGNLPIVDVVGNTHAMVGGDLPVLIGDANSQLSGLPGAPERGSVTFGDSGYVVDPGDPNPLFVQAVIVWSDVCDAPGTVGCAPLVNQSQTGSAATIGIDVGMEPLTPICAYSCEVPAFAIDVVNDPDATTYSWSILNGTINEGQGSDAITFGVEDRDVVLDVTVGTGFAGGDCIPLIIKILPDDDNPIVKCPPVTNVGTGNPVMPGLAAAQVAVDACTCIDELELVSQDPVAGAPVPTGVTQAQVEVADRAGNVGSGPVDIITIWPDIDRDFDVDVDDLVLLFQAWGPCGGGGCAADTNGDGEVDVDDLVTVIQYWS